MSLAATTRTNGLMNGPPESQAPPKILSELQASAQSVDEGDPLQFVVEISRDSDVIVEWFKDGQILNAGSRLNTSIDRGVASLDIFYTYPEDAGTYSCVIRNGFGQVQSNQLQIAVIPEESGNTDDYRKQVEAMGAMNIAEKEVADMRAKAFEVPNFVSQPVSANAQVSEGQGNIFEARINIASDSTLSVDWLKDGKPVGTGSRFDMKADRGYLTLQIAYCYPEDSGQYVCLAKNALGEAKSNPIQFECLPEEKIVTKSILGESSIQTLKALEDPGEAFGGIQAASEEGIPPKFKGNLTPENVELLEDQPVTFSIPVETGTGNILALEWFKDGNLIKYGSRITGGLELGIASLKIKYAQPEDSGTITCRLKTEYGQVESNAVHLVCNPEGSIIAASQLPGDKAKGLQAIENLEAILNAPKEELVDDDGPMPEPSIVKQPEPVGELGDGTNVHFEAFVEPSMDPNLSVEWFKDDKPLTNGSRFKLDYDRGLAMLDILYTIEEDTGKYWCLAKNRAGQVKSDQIPIVCSGKAEVITKSNLLDGSDGYQIIKSIEEAGEDVAYNYDVEEADTSPTFDVRPQAVISCEGGNAKFLVKLSGKPTPEVNWTINGEDIKSDSITKVYNDGAINYLEISRCPLDAGVYAIKVVAQNHLGSAEAETVLTVQASEDFRPDLKHIKPHNPFKKMIGLKKVAVSDELTKALHKAKPTAQALMDMERGSEMRAKAFKSPEVVEAESLLDQIAINLRRQEMKKPVQNGNE